jgi:hypothetical protein
VVIGAIRRFWSCAEIKDCVIASSLAWSIGFPLQL